jgi:hypothetical protein
MSGINSVSLAGPIPTHALANPIAPKTKPAKPEPPWQEAVESLSETRYEADQGDPQAIRKLATLQASSGAQGFENIQPFKGGLDIQT